MTPDLERVSRTDIGKVVISDGVSGEILALCGEVAEGLHQVFTMGGLVSKDRVRLLATVDHSVDSLGLAGKKMANSFQAVDRG